MLFSCEKTASTPESRIAGTWELVRFAGVNQTTGEDLDFMPEIVRLFPCIRQNRITFQDGTYLTSLPADCVGEGSVSLQFFPVSTFGTYAITEDGKFSLQDGVETYEGTYRFDGNNTFIFVIGEGTQTLTVTYDKK